MTQESVLQTIERLAETVPPAHVSAFSADMAKALAAPRQTGAHKGDFGHALLISGSYGMAGATVLAARACMRCGTGLLTIAAPGCNNTILQVSVPSAMTIPDSCQSHITEIPLIDKYTAIGIGPGLGKHTETARAVAILLKVAGRPIVIDADAINIIAANSPLAGLIPEDSILTPHIGELRRLTGCSGEWSDLARAAVRFASEHRCNVVMKGAPTLTISKEGMITVNTTGNPGMATAGSGDVLTGIITALLAQGANPYMAASCGVYIHGLAGDIAAAELTEIAMNSSDIADMLPKAWKTIINEQ